MVQISLDLNSIEEYKHIMFPSFVLIIKSILNTWNDSFLVFVLNFKQSGCCKPPTACGYTFINPTFWISPIDTASDMDCLVWNNDQSQLCYSCDSCKAGLLASLSKQWRKANIILIIVLILLICVYLFGCCAFRNAKTEEIFRKYKQGYT